MRLEKAPVKNGVCRLSDDVVRHIAAGEVIERPASVLKELIENSLDAGATSIQIESIGAGKKTLRIADNGAGMSPEDCRLSFERHTTSKISTIEDLDRLGTFGFRGEALFSIAAVSRIALTSRPRGSAKAWRVEVEGGRVTREHEAGLAEGTVIEMSDLFFNVPARLKFLKSDNSEKGHLLRVIEEAALANPEAAFTYASEGKRGLSLKIAGNRIERIGELLGEDIGGKPIIVDEQAPNLKIFAFLAPTDNLVSSRTMQYFFINRRPVSSKVMSQALYRAYEPFRSEGRHPAAVVFLESPPDRFDVNVHPAKREVRFHSDAPLYESLTGAFSAALLRSKGIPTIARGRIPALYSTNQASQSVHEPAAVYSAATLDLGFGPASALEAPNGAPRWFTPPFRFLGAIEQSYLAFDAAGGLLLVDQHAAQERILFEKYLGEIEVGNLRSQQLAIPIAIDLPASQIQHVLARKSELRRLGIDLEAFGKTTLQVSAVPAVFSKADDIREMLHRLLDSVQSAAGAAADVKAHAISTIACKAAVKAHDALSAQEALALLEDLKSCRDGTACPHGRPSMISLTRDELARRFKRPGAPPL